MHVVSFILVMSGTLLVNLRWAHGQSSSTSISSASSQNTLKKSKWAHELVLELQYDKKIADEYELMKVYLSKPMQGAPSSIKDFKERKKARELTLKHFISQKEKMIAEAASLLESEFVNRFSEEELKYLVEANKNPALKKFLKITENPTFENILNLPKRKSTEFLKYYLNQLKKGQTS